MSIINQLNRTINNINTKVNKLEVAIISFAEGEMLVKLICRANWILQNEVILSPELSLLIRKENDIRANGLT